MCCVIMVMQQGTLESYRTALLALCLTIYIWHRCMKFQLLLEICCHLRCFIILTVDNFQHGILLAVISDDLIYTVLLMQKTSLFGKN